MRFSNTIYTLYDIVRHYFYILFYYVKSSYTISSWGPGEETQASLAWSLAWEHKGHSAAAQLFVNVDEKVWSWGMLVRWTSRPTEWGDICWSLLEGARMTILRCCTKRMRKFRIANMMTSDCGRFKGPPWASEYLWKRGKKWFHSKEKASSSHVQLSLFEGCLARKLRFHTFNFHFLRGVLQESFVPSTFRFWGRPFLRAVLHESFALTTST